MGWADKLRSARRKTENVLIVAIEGDQTAHASIVALASRLPMLVHGERGSYRLAFDQVPGAAPQEFARNIACAKALSAGADVLVMIDNDMILHDPNESFRFLETPDYDIAAPIEYMWRPLDRVAGRAPDAFPCAFMRRPDGQAGQEPVYPVRGQAVTFVDRVGSGCMAIRRHLLEDARMLLAPDCDPPALWRNVYAPNFVRLKGLDMDFCDRARALGYRIAVNWQSEVGHWKKANVNEIDQYAKAQFSLGHAIGVKRGVSLAQGQGRAEGGNGGVDGSGLAAGDKLVGVGLDRTDQAIADDVIARARSAGIGRAG